MALNPKHQGPRKQEGGTDVDRQVVLGKKKKKSWQIAVEGLPGELESAPRNKNFQYI